MTSRFASLAAFTLCFLSPIHAYKQDAKILKITKSNRTNALTPEEQLGRFKLAEGFVIELVASEKNGIINPIDLTFDDAGRLWTQTAEMYPLDPMGDKANRTVRVQIQDPKSPIHKHPEMMRLKRLYQLKDKGTDRIVVIDTPTKPFQGQVRRVAEGLTMPQSILPYKNGVYVAHGSEMLFLEDANGDGVFEKPTPVLTGFSFIDSHTMSHLLTRAPGGWINFSHGAMNLGKVTAVASGTTQQINYCKTARFSLDGKKLELLTSGLNNIWGYQLRANGQYYGSEANDLGMSLVPMEPMTGFEGIGNDKIRPYQPMMPQLHQHRIGGTGLSGLAFDESDSNGFPNLWKDVGFLANPITNTINSVRIDRDASGKVTATHLEDLLKCEDDWFRPVNLEFGPDGCLYIADWYNKIVSHNEVPRTDPSRDKTHGRIWRIRHVSQKPAKIPNLLKAKDEDLLTSLTGSTRWEKRAAWHQIADRQITSLLPGIKEIASNQSSSIGSRVAAIWSYESLGQFDAPFTKKLLQDKDHNIRREVIRSLASFDLSASQVASLVVPAIKDPHVMVRNQTLRTLAEIGKADASTIELLIKASEPLLPGKLAMGGSYERAFQRYLTRLAMEKYPSELRSFLNSPKANDLPIDHILWALQSLGEKSFIELFSKFWVIDKIEDFDPEMFISLGSVIDHPKVQEIVIPVFSNPENHSYLVDLLFKTRSRVDSTRYRKLFAPILAEMSLTPKANRDRLYQLALVLKSSTLAQHAIKELQKNRDSSSIKAALSILMLDPKKNMKHLSDLANDASLPTNLRLETITAFLQANPKAAHPLLAAVVSELSDSERKAATSRLSMTTQGSVSLAKLLAKKIVSVDDFNYLSATRVSTVARRDPAARNLAKIWTQRKQSADKALAQKVDQYSASIERLKGNPAAGKAIFQMCLSCHAVGDQGYSIAPALDGSASRETHALLTALLRPDVAVEGGYELYRVIQKNGTIVEGYLHSSNDIGVTIAAMGNTKTFIPRSDIKSEGGVAGKSFMPQLVDGFPEQTMADLLSFIKTLN